MFIAEIITEARLPVRDQIIAAVQKDGGNIKNYYVRFTSVDQLGFSARQTFGRSPDIDNPLFSVDYIGTGQGRPALWFYPLSYYLKNKNMFASENPYVWLVRIKDTAWLQPVDKNTKKKKPAPAGKERVGLLRLTNVPAAIFFKPAYDLVGKFYDYQQQHQRHGQVKGAPKPNFFDRVRGY